ncbi:DUF349 domain-containing protein [Leadbetterella sp. DM7]|uniref:DUF349 domain-containing protein n=1 Tax=Leadbetterella sp. DM7 TaxID=3235085 RepID=UPI00349EFB30
MKGSTLENEYAYVLDGKVFLKGYLGMPDRQIGEVKNTDEEAFQYFERRYDIAVSKVNQLEEEISNAQNKGSYLTKLLQLRKRLLNFDGIGNFLPLLDKLEVMEKDLVSLIEQNQLSNLQIKRQLIDEAKPYEHSTDWKDTADVLQEIRSRWIRTGPVEKNLNAAIEEEFKSILDTFYQARKAFFEEQNRLIDERVAKYNDLIVKAEELVDRTDWDEAFLDLRNYQTEWKIIGEIPPKILKALFKNFKRPTSIFYEKYCKAKGIQPKRKLDPRVEAQMNMVKEVEKLSESDDMFAATNRAKFLLNEWKTIRIPAHLADRNIAERFRAACDKIFELSYLHKVIARKYPTFNFLSDKQKDLTKYREMDNIVRRARTDLDELIRSYDGQRMDEEMEKMIQSNLKTQRRKLLMKEVILEELRQKAASL